MGVAVASFDRIKVGDTLYDVHRYKTNSGSAEGCWPVVVKEIDVVKKAALCSWNGNTPRWYYEPQIKRLRRTPKKEL